MLGECGVTWVPHVLNRMDEEYEDRLDALSDKLPMKPSEYWSRQGYTTYQHEIGLPQFLPMVGEDNVIWGSDYPHPDRIWPESQKWIEEDLAGGVRRNEAEAYAGECGESLWVGGLSLARDE